MAILGLANLSSAAENKVPMWTNEGVRKVFVDGADEASPENVRQQALRGLYNFSFNATLRPLMVEIGVKAVLTALPEQNGRAERFRRTILQRLLNVAPPVRLTKELRIKIITFLDTHLMHEWQSLDKEFPRVPKDHFKKCIQEYRQYLNATRYDGNSISCLNDKVSVTNYGEECFTAATARMAMASGQNENPVFIFPNHIPATVRLCIGFAGTMIHAGVVFELDTNNEAFEANSLVTEVTNETLPKFLMIHLLNDGVDVETGESVRAVEEVVANVFGPNTPVFSFEISICPITNWIFPLAEVITAHEQKSFQLNVKETGQETNCTFFVLDVLRRLGGGSAFDLSEEKLFELLRTRLEPAVVGDHKIRAFSRKMAKFWAHFLANPSPTYAQGVQSMFKPILDSIGAPRATQHTHGNVTTFEENPRPSKKRRQ